MDTIETCGGTVASVTNVDLDAGTTVQAGLVLARQSRSCGGGSGGSGGGGGGGGGRGGRGGGGGGRGGGGGWGKGGGGGGRGGWGKGGGGGWGKGGGWGRRGRFFWPYDYHQRYVQPAMLYPSCECITHTDHPISINYNPSYANNACNSNDIFDPCFCYSTCPNKFGDLEGEWYNCSSPERGGIGSAGTVCRYSEK